MPPAVGTAPAPRWRGTAPPHNGFSGAAAVWLPAAPRPLEDTVAGQQGVAGSWLEAYRSLVELHRRHRELVDAPAQWLDPDSGLLMAVRRGSLVVACNLDEHDADLVLPEGSWTVVFSSRPGRRVEPGDRITVPAETALILGR